MRRYFRYILLVGALLLPSLAIASGNLKEDSLHTAQGVELRQSAAFSYDLPAHFSIYLEEEIRSEVFGQTFHDGVLCMQEPPTFSKSYTTVGLSWKCLSHQSLNSGYKYGIKLDLAYTLRYLHLKRLNEEGERQDADEYLRHRGTFALTGSVDFGNWKISLRERLLSDIRTDEIDTREKPQAAFELRHRLRLDYDIPGKPLRSFLSEELTHTLNQPTCPYLNEEGQPFYGGQYINSLRTSVGLRWRLDMHNALTLSYTYIYGIDKDYNITRGENVEINATRSHNHIITFSYDLWY